MKLFDGTKKLIGKRKNGENAPGLELTEVFLVQVIQQIVNINKTLKYCTLLCLVNLMLICQMLNQSNQCYNTEFDEIIITFTNQNSRPLEIQDKVNLTLLIDKQK